MSRSEVRANRSSTSAPLARAASRIVDSAASVEVAAGGTVAFYTFTTYTQKFLVNTGGFGKAEATLVSAASLFLYMLLQPLVGALSDRVGRRAVLIAFGALGTVCFVPILGGIAGATTVVQAFAWVMAGLVVTSGYTAVNAVVKAELFPAHIRALGVGLPYAIAVAVFGGTTEFLALWSKRIGHEPYFFVYVAGCAAVSG